MLDTIEVGAAAGVAMEAGRIPWGDGARVLELLESIRKDDPLGLLIGNGCAVTGKALGVRRIPAVKGQSLSAYDPRVLKGTGVTYATCPMGADHTAGNALPSPANPSYDPSSPVRTWTRCLRDKFRDLQNSAGLFFVGLYVTPTVDSFSKITWRAKIFCAAKKHLAFPAVETHRGNTMDS